MRSRTLLSLAAVALCAVLAASSVSARSHSHSRSHSALRGLPKTSDLPVLESFNATQYLGRWYQVYSNDYVSRFEEPNGVCVRADYKLYDPSIGSISVINSQRDFTPDGDGSFVYGTATPDGSQVPGHYSVVLGQNPKAGEYWIIAVGPVVLDQYQWAVVTDSHRQTLFILTRNVADYYQQYDQKVIHFVLQNGFTQPETKPLRTNQTGCVYPPVNNLPVVESFNATQYLGRWFQMYSNAEVERSIEPNGVCVMADYGLFDPDNGTISVFNSQRQSTPDGEVRSISGMAVQSDTNIPGHLDVTLWGQPSRGQYWVIAVGPVVNGEYQWAVVTDYARFTLFILARNIDEFNQKYDQEVFDFAIDNGFTKPDNKPLQTNQTGCVYPTSKPHTDMYARQKIALAEL